MEEYADGSCSLLYFAASAQEDVQELYHKHSPPKAHSEAGHDDASLESVYENARTLLDEDQGGFDEGEKNEVMLMWKHEGADSLQSSSARGQNNV